MNKHQIRRGLKAIAAVDNDVARALAAVGYPSPSEWQPGFTTFLSVIVNQQISYKAAATIYGRVEALLPEMNAEGVLRVSEQALRAAGLSQRKAEYLRGLAEAVVKGDFDPDALADMDDEAAIDAIVQLRGFGRWSAENYMIFALGRRDLFPADDLILLNGLQKLKGLSARPTPKQARALVEHWSPWRSAGSLFLWRYVHSE